MATWRSHFERKTDNNQRTHTYRDHSGPTDSEASAAAIRQAQFSRRSLNYDSPNVVTYVEKID